jgi:hypothetical protein
MTLRDVTLITYPYILTPKSMQCDLSSQLQDILKDTGFSWRLHIDSKARLRVSSAKCQDQRQLNAGLVSRTGTAPLGPSSSQATADLALPAVQRRPQAARGGLKD